MRGVERDPGWPAEPSSCPRMNQQLQTKAMALLTALLQGASPTERKVSIPSGGWVWGQELVGAVFSSRTAEWVPMVSLNHLSPLPTQLSTCLTTCGREIFASSSIR